MSVFVAVGARVFFFFGCGFAATVCCVFLCCSVKDFVMEKIVHLDAIAIPKAYPMPRPSFEHEWVSYETTAYEDIAARCADATIVVTNKCKMTAENMAKMPKLKFIAELATGYNNIDIDYCKAHGIGVATIQGYSTKSVAEHTLAMMLMLSRSLIKTRKKMEDGLWVNANCFCQLPFPIVDLDGRTLTVIGSGAIGSRIGDLARAFGMKVLKAEHRSATSVREGYTAFAEAITTADFISVNCPLNAETTDLITSKEIATMKKSVFIINNARGGVVNEQDLVAAILNGDIAGGAADVASVEPLTPDHPYVKLQQNDNFILTPHQAWMSDDCLVELCRQFKENLEAFHEGKSVRRIV